MGVKISELTEANTIQDNDLLPIVQDGETKKITIETLLKGVFKYNGDAPTDWNNARTFGIYHVGGIDYTNSPYDNYVYGVLIVYESYGGTWTPTEEEAGASWIWQEFRGTNGNVFRRNAVNYSNVWSAWQQV